MPPRLVRLALAILAAVAVLVVFDNLGRPLANPDEGRYAEIAREMAESGDWVTPRLNGFKYFEKPPLQYWATAAAIRLLGPGEVAARLYVALAGLATLAIVGYTGRRLHSGEAGLLAVLALLSSPYFMALGGIVTLDMGLTLWTTAALSALLIAGQAPDPSGRRKWLLAGWAAMALAVLSKGLVGLVIPAAAVALHALVARDWRSLLRLEWARGLPLFLAIAAPWFVAVSLANPEFASFFFIHEHFTRLGRLESGNVCEYFRMKHYFNSLGITKYDQILYEMGMKEKEHKVYFLEKIKDNKLRPFFEKLFSWGSNKGFNDIDLDKKYPVEKSNIYCKK